MEQNTKKQERRLEAIFLLAVFLTILMWALVQPFNKTLLPITAGLEYIAEEGKQGFKLKTVTQNGKALDLKKKYKVTVLDKETYFRLKALELFPEAGESAFVRGKEFVRPNWLRYFQVGKQLAAPTAYVKVE